MSVRDAYDRWSASYDTQRNLTRDTDAHAVRQLLAGARVRFAVEAGCGTGKNTPFYASLAERLLALDFSDAMLARARARATAPHVEFRRHDLAEPWPVAPGTADLVAFNLVLEHFDALDGVLASAAAASRPGATLLISELHPMRQALGSQARFTSGDGGEERVAAFLHHASDFVGTAERAGFALGGLDEWWHESESREVPPRLLTLRFARR